MARRGPIGLRILGALIGLGIGVIAAVMVLLGHHAKPASAPEQTPPSEASATNGA
jgi:hypothetical protein